MKIVHIPCLDDNYAYLIIDESTKEAVDPVELKKVIEAAKELCADIKIVLTTHHRWDHAGGNGDITQLISGVKVYGGSIDKVKGCINKLENGDKLILGADINILSLHTKEGEDPGVFTGDTLFVAGCEKFFEGAAEQMYESLCVTLGSLPKPTRVFCGHEYSEQNLKFASTVEPDNENIKEKLSWAQKQRQANLHMIPSSIGQEFETNPFICVDLTEIQAKVGCGSPVDEIKKIRELKDTWKG